MLIWRGACAFILGLLLNVIICDPWHFALQIFQYCYLQCNTLLVVCSVYVYLHLMVTIVWIYPWRTLSSLTRTNTWCRQRKSCKKTGKSALLKKSEKQTVLNIVRKKFPTGIGLSYYGHTWLYIGKRKSAKKHVIRWKLETIVYLTIFIKYLKRKKNC